MISSDDPKLLTSQALRPRVVGADKNCVLLVEDDPSLRRLLEIILERGKYRYLSAGDGMEAIDVLRENRIALVITDAFMPNLNGYELCRWMKENEAVAHIPIVLLSALDPEPVEMDHADEFLTKPVAPDDFLACVARWISDHRSQISDP
jgi:twitching motility two-component system response regulator PilH